MRTHIKLLSKILFISILSTRGGGSANTEEIIILHPNQSTPTESSNSGESEGQVMIVDDESAKNIVQIAVGSPDHTTLVAAVQVADLVNVLTNNSPLTVFTPTNAAFAALPKVL